MLNNIPFIIYIADICQSFNITLALFMSILWVIVFVLCLSIAIVWNESYDGFNETCQKMTKYMKIFIACSIVTTIGFIVCPSRKVVYAYLGTKTIEVIENNEVITDEAKEIYNDVKEILHTYVREERMEK